MKLKTKTNLKLYFRKIKQNIMMNIAWCLPRSLVYWCAIRLMANATGGKHKNTVVPELTAIEALRRWN